KELHIPMIEVIAGGNIEEGPFTDCETGKLIHSDFLNGLSVEEAKKKMMEWLQETGKGVPKVNFKLRDW
ncbi:MAG: hypothetical protein RR977_05055, partial [Oscillospiraceae bacterium]